MAFKEKIAFLTKKYPKSENILKNKHPDHLKWHEFDKTKWNEDIWWFMAPLDVNSEKYLVFSVDFGHFPLYKYIGRAVTHPSSELNISRTKKDF